MNKYSAQPEQNNGKNDSEKKHKDKFIRINWKIKAKECRLIEDGKPPRIIHTGSAIEYAQNLGLDLVELSYDYKTGISTCKIYDYGKYVYEQKQREKAARKIARANQSDLKCLQMSLTTDTADLNRMILRTKGFLEDGDRVKLSLRFRGRRELANIDMGKDIMKKVLTEFDGLAVLDSAPTLNGKELSCVLRRMQQKKNQSIQNKPAGIVITVNN